jgi:TonB-dependent SusC/RagA subfamily outer membrane receptor
MNRKFATLMLSPVLAGCASASTLRHERDVAQERPVENVAEFLRHHPSVRVEGTGSTMRVSIRGSLGEPLVVLDGIALPRESGRVLAIINPRDVADIRVLTDPADLTFYGFRGANGVIVIRTKRP